MDGYGTLSWLNDSILFQVNMNTGVPSWQWNSCSLHFFASWQSNIARWWFLPCSEGWNLLPGQRIKMNMVFGPKKSLASLTLLVPQSDMLANRQEIVQVPIVQTEDTGFSGVWWWWDLTKQHCNYNYFEKQEFPGLSWKNLQFCVLIFDWSRLSLKFCLRVVAARFGDRDSWKKIGTKKRDRWEGHSSHNSIELVAHLMVFGPTQSQQKLFSATAKLRDEMMTGAILHPGWITQNMNCLTSLSATPHSSYLSEF